VGINGRLDTLQAAIMLAKWPHFEQEVEKRAFLGSRYNEALKNVVHVPEPDAGNTHVYGQYTIRVDQEKRAQLQAYLKQHDIPTGIYYPVCMHQQPVFQQKGFRQIGELQHSIKATQEVLSLPMSPFLTEEEQDKVIECIRRFFS
jgi:UDP-2-acetamido-2-deoxy-ribo-hexuluronate aminotransferase